VKSSSSWIRTSARHVLASRSTRRSAPGRNSQHRRRAGGRRLSTGEGIVTPHLRFPEGSSQVHFRRATVSRTRKHLMDGPQVRLRALSEISYVKPRHGTADSQLPLPPRLSLVASRRMSAKGQQQKLHSIMQRAEEMLTGTRQHDSSTVHIQRRTRTT
jgi:hypothetical protein